MQKGREQLSPADNPNTVTLQGTRQSGAGSMSGVKLPLANLKLQVRSSVTPGVYTDAVHISSASSLTPASQLSSIFANSPVHYDYTGRNFYGVSIQVGSSQVRGILASDEGSPLFDTSPSSGEPPDASQM
jgi:hypothetical protein